jgi:hypothetical protein
MNYSLEGIALYPLTCTILCFPHTHRRSRVRLYTCLSIIGLNSGQRFHQFDMWDAVEISEALKNR